MRAHILCHRTCFALHLYAWLEVFEIILIVTFFIIINVHILQVIAELFPSEQ